VRIFGCREGTNEDVSYARQRPGDSIARHHGLERRIFIMERRTVDVAGVPVSYLSAGDPAGPVLLLLHGTAPAARVAS
jgi:hypothetical protein